MTIASFLHNDCGVTDDGDRLFPASRPSKPLRGADGCFECLPARSVPARCTRLRRVRHVRNGSRCTRRQRCQAAGPGLTVFIQPLAGVYRSPNDVEGATPQTLHAHTHRPIDGHGKIRDSARPAGNGRFWKRKPGTVRRSPTKRGSIPGLVTLRQQGDICGTQTSRLPGPGRPAEHRHTCRRAGFEEIKVRTDSRRLGLS